MIISLNNVYKLIEDNNYKTAIVYENDIIDNTRPFEVVKKNNSSDLINRLKELENIISGKFTLLLGKGTAGEQKRNMTEIKTEFYQTVLETEPVNLNGVDFIESSSNINKRVDELVNKKLADIEKEKEVQELKDKLKELDTMGGKVSYFLQGFITKLMDNSQATTMQGFDPNNQEVTTEMNTNELEENLATIVKYLGQENIKKFANKIEDGSAMAVKPIIINFLN